MLYTVAEVSELIGLSKVSIYKKLKLKELEPHIVKKQGITYIDEEGFNLIKDNLKFNDNIKTEDVNTETNEDITKDVDDLTISKELINALLEQLRAKDEQIKQLTDRLAQEQELHKNTQILLKQEQAKDKQPDILLLEEHFQQIDQRLNKWRDEIATTKQDAQPKKIGLWDRLFKKS